MQTPPRIVSGVTLGCWRMRQPTTIGLANTRRDVKRMTLPVTVSPPCAATTTAASTARATPAHATTCTRRGGREVWNARSTVRPKRTDRTMSATEPVQVTVTAV